jgi:hypothetical protein
MMMMRCLALVLALPLVGVAQFQTTLSAKTTEAFESYLKTAEPQMTGKARFAQLKPNEVRVEPARDDGSIDVQDGIVHDWVAATFVPGATVNQVLAVLQNYPAYKTIYKPEIVDSKLLNRSGDQWRVYLKIVKQKVLTAVLNTEYDVNYRDSGEGRWLMTSRSTRITEIDDDKELPLGTGHGFLWRLNAYWLMEPRGNGVYMECRSISLSRDIPFGLGAVVGRFVNSLPTESLRATIGSTVKVLGQPVASR